MIKNILLPVLLVVAFASCEKVFMKPEPEVNNLNIFDDFSMIFNEKYGMFDQKGVDWQPLSDSVRATIDDGTTQSELGKKMGAMVIRLKDAHSSLITTDAVYTYNHLEGYAVNYDASTFAFQEGATSLGSGFGYKILDDNIGFIYLYNFVTPTVATIDRALEALRDTRGLIIDVRPNFGGNPEIAAELARRFTATGYSVGVESFKTGPGKNDFSPSKIFVTPTSEGRPTYLDKKIAILQARSSYSATSTLIYLTDPNPNVTTFGGQSGGGTGSVTSGNLINGWSYTISVSDYVDANGRKIDDGVVADFPVMIDPTNPDTDEIIQAAIEFILQ